MKDRKIKGSYTVEAALTMPILLFTIALGMKIGLLLYQEIRNEREQELVEELWEVEDFYRNQWISEGLDD